MRLVVNGKERDVPGPLTVSGLLEHLDVTAVAVAVEVNADVLRRGTFDQCELREGDRVEIVRMIGGGGERHVCHSERPAGARNLMAATGTRFLVAALLGMTICG